MMFKDLPLCPAIRLAHASRLREEPARLRAGHIEIGNSVVISRGVRIASYSARQIGEARSTTARVPTHEVTLRRAA